MTKIPFSISLDSDLAAWVKFKAEETGAKPSWIVTQAIKRAKGSETDPLIELASLLDKKDLIEEKIEEKVKEVEEIRLEGDREKREKAQALLREQQEKKATALIRVKPFHDDIVKKGFSDFLERNKDASLTACNALAKELKEKGIEGIDDFTLFSLLNKLDLLQPLSQTNTAKEATPQ